MEDKLVEIITKLQEQLTTFAPQAWKAALAVTRINGLASFVGGVVATALALLIWRKYRKWLKRQEREEGDEIIVMLSWAGIIISGGIGVSILLDPWTYVAIFMPQLEIAHEIIGRLMRVK